MLSRISKISVFGIVALMLAFGLAADDALAQGQLRSGNVYANHDNSPTNLRAAGTATMTFHLRSRVGKPRVQMDRLNARGYAGADGQDYHSIEWSPIAKALSGEPMRMNRAR